MEFTRKENSLILTKDVATLSTTSKNRWPHSVPVSYVYLDDKFYVPANSKSKKIRNLRQNHRATILVGNDETESGVMMECEPKILTGAKARKFREYMRKVKGWKNDETTVIVVLTPMRKASWFFKDV